MTLHKCKEPACYQNTHYQYCAKHTRRESIVKPILSYVRGTHDVVWHVKRSGFRDDYITHCGAKLTGSPVRTDESRGDRVCPDCMRAFDAALLASYRKES